MGRNNKQRRALKERARTQARPSGQHTGAAFGRAGGEARGGAPSDPARDEVEALLDRHMRRALRTLDMGLRPGFDQATAELAAATSDAPRRRVVERTLGGILRDAVSGLWTRGWQPADVVRVARRRLGTQPAGVVRDALADELRRYPPDTVDPRWRAQLEADEVRLWWPSGRHLLGAREAQGLDWAGQVASGIEAFHFMITLPPLEVLTPLPGTAPRIPADATITSEVDERILARVRALLAKAESTPYAAEAETFTAGAQALMARHSIDAAMLATRAAADDRPTARRLGLDPPYEEAKTMLFQAVAAANRCRTVWHKQFGHVTVVGFAADLHAVETLATSLLVQATQAVRDAGSRTTAWGGSRTRSFRQSFLMSFATRIGERLTEATQAETERAAGEGGYERLLPVLAARDGRVDDALADLFPAVTRRPASAAYDGEGWARGRAAADLAALAPGAPLPGVATAG